MTRLDRPHHDASLSDDVYSELKDYILNDVVRPPERLNVGQLSHHFGVSITPIREALIRLASEKIIDLKPGRGFFYKEFRPLEQIENYELIYCILKYAMECNRSRPDVHVCEREGAFLSENKASIHDMTDIRMHLTLKETLYQKIALRTGNKQIISLVCRLCERTRITRILDIELSNDPSVLVDDLKKLATAVEQNDCERAVALLFQRLEKKRSRMNALAAERQRRLYDAYPLMRPGIYR